MSSFVAIISFICGFALEVYSEYLETLLCPSSGFWQDVCLGIFTGSVFSLLISIRTYFIQRDQVLKSFWLSLTTYQQKVSIFGLKYFPSYYTNLQIRYALENSQSLIEEINELQIIYAEEKAKRASITFFNNSGDLFADVEKCISVLDGYNPEFTKLMYFNPRFEQDIPISDRLSETQKEEIIRSFHEGTGQFAQLHDQLTNALECLKDDLHIKTN